MKDEELQNLARDIRARDSTIKELAEKLSETAGAAEAAASAAHTMDGQRRIMCAEVERLTRESERQKELSLLKVLCCSFLFFCFPLLFLQWLFDCSVIM